MGGVTGSGIDDFLAGFAQAFYARCHLDSDMMRRFSSPRDWTHLMLGEPIGASPHGVLLGAASHWADRHIGLSRYSLRREWYTIDLSVVASTDGPSEPYWECSTRVAIEHENGDDVETEMWKLAHWRSDLSVLIFYDFSVDEVASEATYSGDKTLPNVRKAEWLTKKLELLSRIVGQVEAISRSRHLLLIGQRTSAQDVRWRSSVWESDQFCLPRLLPQ